MEPDKEDLKESGARIDQSEVQESGKKTRRDFRITKKLFEKFKASPGCPACEAMDMGTGSQGRSHTPECRKRYEEEMARSKEFRKILHQRDVRHNLAEEDLDEDDEEPRIGARKLKDERRT